MRSVYSHCLPNPSPHARLTHKYRLYCLLLMNKSMAFNINIKQNKLTKILGILKNLIQATTCKAVFLFKSLTNYQYLDKEYSHRKSGKGAFYITRIESMWHTKKKNYSTKSIHNNSLMIKDYGTKMV